MEGSSGDSYPFDLAGFTEPIRTDSATAQLWFDRGLLQVSLQSCSARVRMEPLFVSFTNLLGTLLVTSLR